MEEPPRSMEALRELLSREIHVGIMCDYKRDALISCEQKKRPPPNWPFMPGLPSQERVGKIYYMDQNIQFLVEVKSVEDLKDMCQLQVALHLGLH